MLKCKNGVFPTFLSLLMLAMILNHASKFVLYNVFDRGFRRKALRLFRLTKEQLSTRIMKITIQESKQVETNLARTTV